MMGYNLEAKINSFLSSLFLALVVLIAVEKQIRTEIGTKKGISVTNLCCLGEDLRKCLELWA